MCLQTAEEAKKETKKKESEVRGEEERDEGGRGVCDVDEVEDVRRVEDSLAVINRQKESDEVRCGRV